MCIGELQAPAAPGITLEGDCLYNMLKLYILDNGRLDSFLDAKTFSKSKMDVREAWLLYAVLNRAKKSFSEFSNDIADNLSMSFAYQLEVLGLWDIACFVALFLSVPDARTRLIKELLERNFPLSDKSGSCLNGITNGVVVPDTALWKFLVGQLRIPVQWIHEAKLLRARYEDNHVVEIGSLIDAGHSFAAHRYLFTHLLSESIVQGGFVFANSCYTGEYFYLKALLSRIDKNVVGTGWQVGGGLVMQFIEIVESLPDVLDLAVGSAGPSREKDAKKEILEQWGPKMRDFFLAVVKSERFAWAKNYWKIDNLEDSGIGLSQLHICATEMATRVSCLLSRCEGVVSFAPSLDLDLLEQLPLGSNARIARVAHGFKK